MAIVNGKKLYGSRKLTTIARQEDRAAAEYAWLMSGTGDDWGRFKANPRSILGDAYAHRPDVSEADVGRWLKRYDEVRVEDEEWGLVRFYTVDGVVYGEWTNYMGDPPSQREHHSCPEPPWSTHKHSKTCKLWGDAKKVLPYKGRSRGTPRATPNGHTTDPPYPSVPPETENGLSTTRAGSAVDLADFELPHDLDIRPTRPPNPLVDRPRLEREGYDLVSEIAPKANLDPTEVLGQASEYEGRRYVRFESMNEDRLAQTLIGLRSWARRLRGEPEPTLPASRASPPRMAPATQATVAAVQAVAERERRRREQ